MRILIAEDDQVLADGLLRALRASGYAVDQVGSGSEADAALASHEFDCLILDLGLPKMHGFDVLRKLRGRGSSVPVLILTAADSVEQRVKGLDLGADDYMAKPFSLQELEARVRALTRRGLGTASSVIKHGPLTFDATGRVAYINEQMIELSARELSLLEVLLQRAGRLVSKDQLVERLCEWGEEVSNNAIEVYIHRLRKKIEQGPVRIATVRGLGTASSRIKHGPLTFDASGRVAYMNDQMIELSARELSLLEILLQRAGRLVSKDQLVERLCEWGDEVSSNAIEVYIHRLRKKIEQGPVRIATVRGLGYCLEKLNG